ncbi:NAD-dependent epimerase/dehydratase family protein [Sphingobacterium hungaricum]|uniref:Nucleoside-diphosphate sugar epimerase n=1 Tax=Sphingobacterium hungaricum TaxID=2082723 RepID=A0A928YPF7_9SPHI|nr:NAD-dependent epimerase/dehydratase family protein [Sphingobacterium hungaricum]MBE8713096.1 nucleoside-diphosphate sugar epimerase [Sphingobacterium hungaricum]
MILVTGGTGFLGATVIHLLIQEGKDVLATKRASSTIPDILKSSSLIQWIDADISDYFALSEIFDGVTQVYHCAAKISYQKADAKSMLHTNIEGTKHLVNLCMEHGARLLHVSSIAALGTNKQGLPVSEDDKWERDPQIAVYSLSKYESEMEVWRGIVEGLDAVIVNPSVIMGPGSGTKGSGVIFNMVNKGLKIYPPGTVGIVDVVDVAKVMIELMGKTEITGERYILNSENLTNKDLLTRISILLDKPAPTIEAKPFMLGIAWRVAKVISLFTGGRPALTAESARASASKLAYTNDKIIQATGFEFKSADAILKEIQETYYPKTS